MSSNLKKNNSNGKRAKVRGVDQLVKDVRQWSGKTFIYINKTKVDTGKAIFIIALVTGLAFATIWGYYSGYFQGSRAGEYTKLILSPASWTTTMGATFPIDVVVDTNGENAVAVKAIVNYDKNSFQLEDVSTDQSAFSLNNSCTYQGKPCEIITRDDANGKVTITLAKPSPGLLATTSGMIARLTFSAKNLTAPSNPNITIEYTAVGSYDDSDVIIDDGFGSDTLELVQNATVMVTADPVYSCTGTTPANSSICDMDNQDLTEDTPKTLADVCGQPKCEYLCNVGYYKSGNQCLPYACTGATPWNAVLCAGDNQGLTMATPKTLVDTCGQPKCEYQCSEGYVKEGDQCQALPGFACIGTIPTNASLCTGDGQGLTENTQRTLVTSCGTPKCEYLCNNGYKLENGACVPSAVTCTEFKYSEWGSCSDGRQYRTIELRLPEGCTGGDPEALERGCNSSITDKDRPIKIEGEKGKFGKSNKFYSNSRSVTFQGSSADVGGGRVRILQDGDEVEDFKVGSNGEWKESVRVKKDGKYDFKIKYYDSNGSEIAVSKTYEVVVDTTDPEFTDLPLFLRKRRGDKIWWKADDNLGIDYYRVTFLGKINRTKDDSFNVPLDTPAGLHTLKVQIYDEVGNRATRYVTILVR